MTQVVNFRNSDISPEDLAMLRGVLEAWCRETHTSMTSADAARVSVELTDWFYFGITRRHQLLEMIRPL